jgi:sec-independent protein translocase protein TatA
MSIGIWQLILILVIILLIFGAGKLPKVMKDIGSGIKNLKEGLKNEEKEDKKDK